MKPDAASTIDREHASWLSASQVRFIRGSAVSLDASATVMYSLFKQSLGAGIAASGTLSFTASASGDVVRQVDQNAAGETVTFSIKGKVTASAGVALRASRSGGSGDQTFTVQTGSNKINQSRSTSLDMEQRFKIVTGLRASMPPPASKPNVSPPGSRP